MFAQPGNRVIRVRAVDPFVAVHPQSELEIDAAGNGLLADIAQHLEIVIALAVRELRNTNVVPGYRHEEGIREQEVRVRDLTNEVITDSECEVESIEALAGQEIEILRPHLAIIEPG